MGEGIRLRCDKCGHSFSANLGIGFCYPIQCEELLAAMRAGSFGKSFMRASEAPDAAVHFSNELYRCKACGLIKSAPEIDLCIPISGGEITKGKFCAASNNLKKQPYVMASDIGDKYRIVLSKKHRCGKCRKPMERVRSLNKLVCPHCGEIMTQGRFIRWD